MARRKVFKGRRRSVVPRQTQRIRKLSGQAPITRMERLASYAGTAGRIATAVSNMAGMINSEAKYVDVSVAGTVDTLGSYFGAILNTMAEGDDVSQRNGRTILAKDITIRGSVVCPSSGAPQVAGYALILDKKYAGTPSIWSQVFTGLDADAPVDRNETDRYVILKRGWWSFSPNNTSRHFKIYLSLKGIHVHFNGTAGTNIDNNAIQLIAYSPLGVGNQPVVTGYSRFNYYDN